MAAADTPEAAAKTVCVLGASGQVGTLVVRQLLTDGFKVVAVSRSADKLAHITASLGKSGALATLQGDVGSDAQAGELRDRFVAAHGNPHAVVASLSSSEVDGQMRILDSPTDVLRKAFDTNFFTHVIAAKAWIPTLASGGTYVGINGGLADFAQAGMAQLTTTQSALHALYTVLAREAQDARRPQNKRPFVRALELFGLVDDGSTRVQNAEMRIDGVAVGTRVSEIIASPNFFPTPVVALKSPAFA